MCSILESKDGFSYVSVCVILIIVMMLVAVAMQYAFIYHVAKEQRKETQLKLDGYVTQCAVENYNALKQGDAWSGHIDRPELVEGAYDLLGFSRIITLEYRPAVDREGKYEMANPTIHALAGDAFGVVVEYEIVIPFELFNRKVADVTVPVTLVSQFKQK